MKLISQLTSNNITSSLFGYSLGQVAQMAFSLLIIPIITNIISTEQFGIYSLYSITITFVSSIVGGWISESLIRYYPNYEKINLSNVFINEFLRILLKTLVFVNILYFAMYLILLRSEPIQVSLTIILYFNSLCIFNFLINILRVKNHNKTYSFFNTLNVALGGFFSVIFVHIFGKHFSYLFVGLFLGNTFSIILIYYQNLFSIIPLRKKHLHESINSYLQYGFPIIFSYLTFWVLNYSSRYFLLIYTNPSEVGVYSLGAMLSEKIMMGIASLFVLYAGPRVIEVYELNGVESLKKLLNEITIYAIYLVIPAFFGFNAVKRTIFLIFFSKIYLNGSDVIIFISASFVLALLAYMHSLVFNVIKKSKMISYLALTAALSNLLFNYLFVPKFQILGASLSLLFSYSIYLVLTVILSRKYIKWHFPFNELLVSIFSSVIMTICILLFKNFVIDLKIQLVSSIIVGIVVYSLLVYILNYRTLSKL